MAPQIHQQLPDINVIAASMGTAGAYPAALACSRRLRLTRVTGTMTGLGTYFGKAKPSVYRIAWVRALPGRRRRR